MLPWATVPLIGGALLLAAVQRPPLFKPPYAVLDAALVAWLTLAAAALVPLPTAARVAVARGSATVDSTLYLRVPLEPASGPPRPLSVDPAATRSALALGTALLLIFWSARAIAARGGLRATARGIAWLGLALAVLALVQHGTAPELLYWAIRPSGRRPAPFGPFVNRNDFATFLIMALPAAAGYGIARVQSRHRADGGPIALEATLDARGLWLVGSVFFMSAALLVAVSRSGLMGALAGLAALLWLAPRRMHRSDVGKVIAIAGSVVAGAATYASWNTLATRVEETLTAGLGGRREIWERTWAMAADFPLTGVGIGAYQRAMSVYQQQPHAFYFNHAHNEYLQLLAEGGIVLALPAAVAIISAAWIIWRRLDLDYSAVFWIRAGAASGMLAAAVQSIWDTGLRVPANGVLFALLAAIAMHDGSAHASGRRRGHSHGDDRESDDAARNHFGTPRTIREA